jgi:hypothetical protein
MHQSYFWQPVKKSSVSWLVGFDYGASMIVDGLKQGLNILCFEMYCYKVEAVHYKREVISFINSAGFILLIYLYLI